MIVLSSKNCRVQPQHPVVIDLSNPFGDLVNEAILPIYGRDVYLIKSGILLTTRDSVTLNITPQGLGLFGGANGSGTNGHYLTAPQHMKLQTHSMYWHGLCNSTTNGSGVLFGIAANDTLNSPSNCLQIRRNSTTNIAYGWNNANTGKNLTVNSIISTGEVLSLGISHRSGLVEGFKNGVLQNNSTDAGSITYSSSSNLVLGGGGNSGIYTNTTTFLAVQFSAALPPDAWLEYEKNRWQIFRRDPKTVYFIPAATGGQTISPGKGAVSITGYAPVISQPNTVATVKGGAAITGYAAVVSQPNTIALEKGSAAFTGYSPVISQSASQTIQAVAGHATITGYAPVISQPNTLALEKGGAAFTGYVPTVLQPQTLGLEVGSIVYTGYAPTIRQGETQTVAPAVGHVAITGYVPAVLQPNAIGLEIGHIVYTGRAPIVRQVIAGRVEPETGHVAITGHAPSVRRIEPETVAIQDAFSLLHTTIFDDVNIGEWVVYTAPNGAPVSVRASVTRNAQLVGEYGQVLENRITARLPLSSVTPVLGGRVTIGLRTYTVEKQISENNHVAEVLLR